VAILALDIGGTKTLMGVVEGGVCRDVRRIPTEGRDPQRWLEAAAAAARTLLPGCTCVAAALSGLVTDGKWWALNPRVLPVPPGFPVEAELGRRLGLPVVALNDGQAAAWGEYRFGAGQHSDMVFVTLSTGVGGGIVLDGRLRTGRHGVAGHIGQIRLGDGIDAPWVENIASGGAVAGGVPLPLAIERIAGVLAGVQALLAPDCFVIGGGMGLAAGMLDRLRAAVAPLPPAVRPELRAAALGAEAGLIGAADFSITQGGLA